MNPILPAITSSSSSHLQQQYDDEMHSILPRIEITDVLFSSTLDSDSESTSSIHKGEPSLKHAHNHDTDDDASITTKKPKRQHHHDCVHSDTNTTHVHVDNNITMTNNKNSSAAEIGSGLRSMKRATAVQDNANKIWQKRYEELIAFKQQNGHCNVPRKNDQNKALCSWVSKQRYQYGLLCNGKQSFMTKDRIAALENIGFEWGLDHNSSWQTQYDKLSTYKKQHGHCNVPQKYTPNKSLSIWVTKQRYQYGLLCKGKQSSMTSERIAALENIGFGWSLKKKTFMADET